MNHEIYSTTGELLETLPWEGEPWSPDSDSAGERREQLRARAVERAYELGALAFERRNPNWVESDHVSFSCHEVSEDKVEVESPVGKFRLRARRVKTGDSKTAVTVGRGITGFGATATSDQLSPPVRIHGRLNPPWSLWRGKVVPEGSGKWTFQPSSFEYEDGSHSDYLGSYPIDVTLEPK